jgi:NADH:ubiquinone oxidoreductase subunit 4 (subunit M)
MNTNVGGIDKILRIVAGIALVTMAAMGIIGMWGFIGVVPLLTGLMGWCPAYTLLGIKTCPMQKT